MTGTLLLYFNVTIRHGHLSCGYRGVKWGFFGKIVLQTILLLDIFDENLQKSDSARKSVMTQMLLCPKISLQLTLGGKVRLQDDYVL